MGHLTRFRHVIISIILVLLLYGIIAGLLRHNHDVTTVKPQNSPATHHAKKKNPNLLDQPSNTSLLVFNRIPKTGSEMFVLLLQWLEGDNNFKHIRLRNTENRRLNPFEQVINKGFILSFSF